VATLLRTSPHSNCCGAQLVYLGDSNGYTRQVSAEQFIALVKRDLQLATPNLRAGLMVRFLSVPAEALTEFRQLITGQEHWHEIGSTETETVFVRCNVGL
jgi:hypothetical protein